MTEGLAAALQDQGRPLIWLRLDATDCDPASCLLDIIHAAQRLSPQIGENTISEMQRSPGSIYGWSHLFTKVGQELEKNLPASTAVVIEGMDALIETNPPLIKNISTMLDKLPQEMNLVIISQEDLPTELMLDWKIALRSRSMIIHPEDWQEAAKLSGIQVSKQIFQRIFKLTGGNTTIISGVLDACKLLGPKYIESLVEHTSSQDLLLKNIASSSFRCYKPEELLVCYLTLETGYYHPEISQAVCGYKKENSDPWLQPLEDDWQYLRSIWKTPLASTLRINVQEIRELLLRAAVFFEKSDENELAMKIYLRLNEFNRAATLMASLLNEMLNTGQWLNLKRWLNEIPEHVLKNWPWLIYARGEIEAIEGNERSAYTNFLIAKNIFTQEKDILGISYSLLGKSILDARQGDLSNASESAKKLHSLGKKHEFKEQMSLANYQLGLLSANSNQPSEALEYFSLAAANLNDPNFSKYLEEVQAQVKECAILTEKSSYHRQELQLAEGHLHENTKKMELLWRSKPDYLPALLEKYGWLQTPLIHKLPAFDRNQIALNGANEPKLIKKLMIKLGLYSNSREDTSASQSFVMELPTIPNNQSPTHISNKTTQAHTLVSDQSEALLQSAQDDAINQFKVHKINKHSKPGVPKITVYCLGAFRVYQDEKPVEGGFSGKGKAIFKYLVTHRERPVAKEILMDIFWPDNDSDAARNNLNVAIYSLRQALRLPHPSYSHVIFQDECYMLNPEIDIWLDSELFLEIIASAKSLEQAGELASAIDLYNNAEALYQGEFMEEDRYEDWPRALRQHLQEEYIKLLDRVSKYHFDQGSLNACTTACRNILTVDPCREETHRIMMQCFHLQGQPYLALRQYHQCIEALKNELQITPTSRTTELYNTIRLQQDD